MEQEERERSRLQAEMEEVKRAQRDAEAQLEAMQTRLTEFRVREQQLSQDLLKLAKCKSEEASHLDPQVQYRDGESREERREKVKLNIRQVEEFLEDQRAKVRRGDVPPQVQDLRFLSEDDPRGHVKERIALASYPRSGNSLLRRIVEKLSGVFTGSDSDPRRPLNQKLVRGGMLGEGMVAHQVFAIKTHFPERLGWTQFEAHRVILVVRNPFDALVSYFNMVLTDSHTETILDDEYHKYHEVWDAFVHEEMDIWREFYAHWHSKALTSKVEVLTVRYEDMVEYRRETYEKIAKFIFRCDSLQGTPYEERLNQALSTDQKSIGAYPPRQDANESDDVSMGLCGSNTLSSSSLGEDASSATLTQDQGKKFAPLPASALRNLRYFSRAQIKYVLGTARSELSALGYWDSFFKAYGEPFIHRPLNTCLVVKTGDSKDPLVQDSWIITFNARRNIRPITRDDPYGRGFGRRWRFLIGQLPPVQTRTKSTI